MMTARKSSFPLSTEALELVASRFRVVGEPARLQILQALHEREMSIGALAEHLGLSQPNVSKRVKTLQEAGFLARRQQGNTVYCSISDKSVFQLCDLVCFSLRERLASQSSLMKVARSVRRS